MKPTSPETGFSRLTLPDGAIAFVPQDVTITFPLRGTVADDRLHLLAYIPWEDRYLAHVPDQYRAFFRHALPYLGARTTDVHTALSVSFLPELLAATPQQVDETVLYMSVILHDSGWAQLSPEQIADSLDYRGLSYSPEALKPKELHATIGSRMAKKLLTEYPNELQLSVAQKSFICELIYYHDQIRPWPQQPEPIEYLLLGDADRLWSYSHENFWLDTIRKGTEPAEYLTRLRSAIDDFFLTEQGKTIARQRINDRAKEVDHYLVASVSG